MYNEQMNEMKLEHIQHYKKIVWKEEKKGFGFFFSHTHTLPLNKASEKKIFFSLFHLHWSIFVVFKKQQQQQQQQQ